MPGLHPDGRQHGYLWFHPKNANMEKIFAKYATELLLPFALQVCSTCLLFIVLFRCLHSDYLLCCFVVHVFWRFLVKHFLGTCFVLGKLVNSG